MRIFLCVFAPLRETAFTLAREMALTTIGVSRKDAKSPLVSGRASLAIEMKQAWLEDKTPARCRPAPPAAVLETDEPGRDESN